MAPVSEVGEFGVKELSARKLGFVGMLKVGRGW